MIPLREFCDSPEIVNLSRLVLRVWLATSLESAVVVESAATWQCKFCDAEVGSEPEALAHFSEHWEQFITQDSSGERRPYAAYRCESCGKVVYAWHDTDFDGVSRHATRHSGAKFTPVDVPVTGKCKCGFEVKRLSEEGFVTHLTTAHNLGELFKLI
jgi:hypothetical protein